MNCPYCKKYFAKKDAAVDHLTKVHAAQLDREDFTPEQALYFYTHGTLHGVCMCGCGKATEWNDKTGKPYKVSPDPKCRERLRAKATSNMMRTYGKTTLLDNMEQQRKMQEHRPTAGKYKFADGGEVGYLSKPEEAFLRFCDTILDLPSRCIQKSPEIFTYTDPTDGKVRQYDPDFYLPDYNLIVEIKDGGSHTNTNPAFVKETKYKVDLKDEVMRKQKDYNYIKIVDNKFGPFVEILYQIVHERSDRGMKSKQPFIVITESACQDIMTDIETSDQYVSCKELYLTAVYQTNPAMIKYLMASFNQGNGIYFVTDYQNNSLTLRPISEIDIDSTDVVNRYRYIGDTDKLNDLYQFLTNALDAPDQMGWNIAEICREVASIWITIPMITNNHHMMCNFIVMNS